MMKPGAAASRPGGTVAFSWEQEPGVSKQSAAEANKPAARALRATDDGKRTPTVSASKAAAAAAGHAHRLRVPPPPGGPGAPAASPLPGRSRSRSRGVRPGHDDPFLAAYRACTANGGSAATASEGKRAQKLLGWAGLGLGVGLGLRGYGLSCKGSCDAVESSVVRLARIPEDDED
ncbi:hypothetical protein ACP70R_025160 [Stipagrostis hirtigluma subsp. patula]